MNFIPINRNTVALITVALIGIGFFAAGLAKTLDYFIIKALLFLSFLVLLGFAIFYGIKNRPSESQDDKK